MPSDRSLIRRKTFRFQNGFWDECAYVIGGWMSWVASHVLRRPHARPIKPRTHTNRQQQDTTHSLAFTCSLVALHAKLAKFKGSLSADAFLEFRCLFPVGDAESQNLRILFKLAWKDEEPLESHTQRMMRCYPDRQDLFVQVMEGLARHMLADGKPSKIQLHWLNQVATQFNIHRLQMRHIIQQAQRPLEAQPYALFNIPKHARESEIKRAYMAFIQRCHPDHHQQAHLPETRMASEYLTKAATNAYQKLH